MYDYFLVYAAELKKGSGLEFVEILDTPVGLKGLFIYYGSAFDDLSEYTYLGTATSIKTKDVDWIQLSLPILISSESATVVLRNYNGKWIEVTEIND